MGWFNFYGLIIIAIIMIPNIVFAIKNKDGFTNSYKNKPLEVFEQIGRYGCFILMIFNIPRTYFNYWFANAEIVYLAVNGILCFTYCFFWILFWEKNGKAKALLLSVIPSTMFLFSGVVIANIPLIVFAVIFSITHIRLSCKNAC